MRTFLLASVSLLAACSALVSQGHVWRFRGATECRTAGNTLPRVYALTTDGPRVDTWFTLRGARGTTPLRTDPPIAAAWLIGHNRLSPPFTTATAPGCVLLVDAFASLVCLDRDPSGAVLSPKKRIAAWREGPHAYLLLRPEPALLGRSLFIQLGVLAPGENTVGVLISNGIELEIGEA